jgi:hypothetical protein
MMKISFRQTSLTILLFALAEIKNRGDTSSMTLTADEDGRLTSRELFPPKTCFAVSKTEEGEIILKKLAPQAYRRVFGKLKRIDGRLVFVFPGTLTPTAIEEAIRAERDSR